MRLIPYQWPPSLKPLELPLYSTRVSAGFPSPADDYKEEGFDLHRHLIKHPSATYCVHAEGDSMQDRGIYSGDPLIVDRSVEPVNGCIVIAAIDGALTCKTVDLNNRMLLPANKQHKPIPIPEDMDVICEGVVISSIRYHYLQSR